MLNGEKDLLATLRRLNPWWVTGNVPAGLTVRKERNAFHEILHILSTGTRRAVLLAGARRVGKTTLLYQLAENFLDPGIAGFPPKNVLYLSLDDPLLRGVSLRRLLDLYEREMGPREGQRLLLLDEIQYSDQGEVWVKGLVDREPHWRIVATGSAAILLRERLAESGAGRWVTVQVPPLTFYEFLRLRQVPDPLDSLDDVLSLNWDLAALPQLPPERLRELGQTAFTLERFLRPYLLQGGFPETALAQDLGFAQRALREDVVDKVLTRDLAELYQLRGTQDVEGLFLYLCRHSGQMLSQETVAKEMGVTRNTVAHSLDRLASVHLIQRLSPWQPDGKGMLRPRSKAYVNHPSLSLSILLRGEEALDNPEEMGRLVESVVVTNLIHFYYRERPRFGYWRERQSQREVDLVVDLQDKVMAVEVKYREESKLGKRDGLPLFVTSAERPVQAMLVTKNAEDYGLLDVGENGGRAVIFRVPASLFLYLLGWMERRRFS